MPKPKPALGPSELDLVVQNRLSVLEHVSLGAVFALVALNLAAWVIVPGGRLPIGSWPLMGAEAEVCALFGALSLDFLLSQRGTWMHRIGLLLAAVVALLGAAIMAEHLFHISFGYDVAIGLNYQGVLPFAARPSRQIAAGFALFGITVLFVQAQRRVAVLVADLLTCGLVLLSLTLASGQVIDITGAFGPPVDSGISMQATLCLLLLTVAVFTRKTRTGVLSVFVGRGAGSKLARGLSPLLIFLPYLRELARAHLINWRRMPPPYTTALLATLVMIVSMSLLIYLAWRINCMEVEIHALSLRDELTGLYNLRGFRLLADQALRMAHRSGGHFSVLFVDLDDLKGTNDRLGHQAGSECLVETAEILKSTFRESDVLGRIGGDEFAVAGEFSPSAIRLAAHRLSELAAHRNAADDRELGLGFSIGHVTSEVDKWEPLDSLLAKADQAMYQEKRRKKVLVN